jgi:salicylate biosynthesis isochorismate synthase/menaquinone-specific isochorismate synthase
MADIAIGTPPPQWLDGAGQARLERRVTIALRRARASGASVLASVTAPLSGAVDPSATVAASRAPAEPWFCLEQPQREGYALAALGAVWKLEAQGADRFSALDRRWRGVARAAVAEEPGGPAGSGVVAVGGFAFAPDGGSSSAWAGFAPASLAVPEISIYRRGNDARLTVNVGVQPDDTAADALGRAHRALARLRSAPLPLLDPAPTGTFRVSSALPPSHYEDAVARAVERIRAGRLEKVVLAREVEVHAPVDHDPAAILGVLREGFSSCYVFAVGRGDAAFIAASPELLVRCEGQRASTVALAGSARRSADPAVDDHLGEQLLRSEKDRQENAIVARRIARTLHSRALWVTAAPEPVLIRVANIQHLARPIRAQLAEPIGATMLAGLLHPTPAVGGEPFAVARELIPALEGLDRGWYAGAVGWTDLAGDGEFCVALRCALLRGRIARCYAGGGIVADSDPAAELAETEIKLEALLPVLAA